MKNKKLNIGFFTDTYTPQINGVVTSIQIFKKYLEKLNHKVYIFAPTPKQKNDSSKIIRFPSVKFIFQPEMRVALPYSKAALNLTKKIKLDIIHSHDPFSIGLFGLWVAKQQKIPYVHTYHTLYPEYVHYIWDTPFTKNLAKKLSEKFCNKCDLIIAPSTKIKNFLKEWGVKKPIEILPTGVEIENFKTKNKDILKFKKKYKILPKDRLLIYVGRIAKEKNIELLIRTLKFIKTQNTKILIVGGGPYLPKLENFIKKEKAKNKVIVSGYLSHKEVILALKTSEVFVFSSKTETQGLVIIEAMASGLPIVAVDDLAIADVIKNGKNGFLVKSKPQDFALKINKLLGDKNLYKNFSKNSKNSASKFSAKKQTKKLEKIYQNLIKKYKINKGS